MDLNKSLTKMWQRLFPTEDQRAERTRKDEINHLKTSLDLAVRGRVFDRAAQERYTQAVVATGMWALSSPNCYKDIGSVTEQKEAIQKFSNALMERGITRNEIEGLIKNTQEDMHKFDPKPYDVW